MHDASCFGSLSWWQRRLAWSLVVPEGHPLRPQGSSPFPRIQQAPSETMVPKRRRLPRPVFHSPPDTPRGHANNGSTSCGPSRNATTPTRRAALRNKGESRCHGASRRMEALRTCALSQVTLMPQTCSRASAPRSRTLDFHHSKKALIEFRSRLAWHKKAKRRRIPMSSTDGPISSAWVAPRAAHQSAMPTVHPSVQTKDGWRAPA